MPGSQSTGAANASPSNGREPQNLMDQLSQIGLRLLLVFLAYSIMQGFMAPNQEAPKPSSTTGTATATTTAPVRVANFYEDGNVFDWTVYISEKASMSAEDVQQLTPDWVGENMTYDFGTTNSKQFEKNFTLSDNFRHGNGSMWMHMYVSPKQATSIPTTYVKHRMVEWRAKDPSKETVSLLEKRDVAEVLNDEPDSLKEHTGNSDTPMEYVRYWKPELYLEYVVTKEKLGTGRIPPPVEKRFKVVADTEKYLPPVFVNEFWLLKENHIMADASVEQVPLKLVIGPMSMMKFNIFMTVEQSWKDNPIMPIKGDEIEQIKRTLIETNPWLLALTTVVSLAHTLLEMLAFKSDISHWRNVKSMEGVSVRSMFWKVGMEIVIFLYLLDNETSWMIIMSAGVNALIEVWKLRKAVNFKSFGKAKIFKFIPWFEYEDKRSYSQSKTKEYDDQAMQYLGYFLYPSVALYAIYSLVYDKHRSWYSWIISSLVGAVYAFGFMMMFPQIFINYKLKSVAHLPMKAFMYKALNTVIDDLFSFIIKMPTLHRLACFRDDIVFAIFLYQKWKYPVDKTRVNEFGQVFEEKPKKKKTKKTKKTAGPVDTSPASAEVSAAIVDESKSEEEKKND
ncbi:hypothetical protein NDN08_002748 [Rhodosorus marinus]|uniref:Cleft lip and palate transmembrane protein 1 n=1 Tax=Rhodosorus marinus TaxID=101924 RepID=A0AAV8UUM0_9RHOD|nr:hypothetical protein NDN08_002748 [Rhodosorus marinus]